MCIYGERRRRGRPWLAGGLSQHMDWLEPVGLLLSKDRRGGRRVGAAWLTGRAEEDWPQKRRWVCWHVGSVVHTQHTSSSCG
jgi:hypothetical protein